MKNLTPVNVERKRGILIKGVKPGFAWGVMWDSRNRLDGVSRHLIHTTSGVPVLFKTRRLALQFIESEYGYIRHRPDLRREPHGWRMPKAVKVTITPNGPDKQRA